MQCRSGFDPRAGSAVLRRNFSQHAALFVPQAGSLSADTTPHLVCCLALPARLQLKGKALLCCMQLLNCGVTLLQDETRCSTLDSGRWR